MMGHDDIKRALTALESIADSMTKLVAFAETIEEHLVTHEQRRQEKE